jgi:outer membrane protein
VGAKKACRELQKETRIGYAQQALAQQLQQQAGVEMDSLVSGLKNSLKITEKERIFLHIWNWRCSNCIC